MADKLTQEEIDALFGISSSGIDTIESKAQSDDRKYKIYDFKNPKTFSKEQIRKISIIYENYAKHLTAYCSGILRTDCLVSVDSIEELRYYEYNNALPESIYMAVLDVPPIQGNMILEINKETCYMVIDRLLGGTGDDVLAQEDFSEIDLRLLEKFTRQILGFLKDAWTSVVNITPEFKRFETNARLTQIMPLDEIVIIVLYKFKIREHMGSMSVCIPCLNLDSILGKSSSYSVFNRTNSEKDKEKNKNNIMENMKTAKVNVAGILGKTTITIQELLYMQVGDVIPLDKSVTEPITLRVGRNDWFNCEVGTKKNKIAVKIKDVISDL